MSVLFLLTKCFILTCFLNIRISNIVHKYTPLLNRNLFSNNYILYFYNSASTNNNYRHLQLQCKTVFRFLKLLWRSIVLSIVGVRLLENRLKKKRLCAVFFNILNHSRVTHKWTVLNHCDLLKKNLLLMSKPSIFNSWIPNPTYKRK